MHQSLTNISYIVMLQLQFTFNMFHVSVDESIVQVLIGMKSIKPSCRHET